MEVHEKYECRMKSSLKKNEKTKRFIRIQMIGLEENILQFDDLTKMTVCNVLCEMRKRCRNINDELYLENEQYNKEELLKTANVQHGRTYICKRRQYKQ